jgi:hypothetical protein
VSALNAIPGSFLAHRAPLFIDRLLGNNINRRARLNKAIILNLAETAASRSNCAARFLRFVVGFAGLRSDAGGRLALRT